MSGGGVIMCGEQCTADKSCNEVVTTGGYQDLISESLLYWGQGKEGSTQQAPLSSHPSAEATTIVIFSVLLEPIFDFIVFFRLG